MENSKHPNFTFTLLGGAYLVGGLFLGTLLSSLIDLFCKFFLYIEVQKEGWFMMVSNALVFSLAILFFDYFIVRPTTQKKLSFNLQPTNFYTYLLIFPMMLGMMFIVEYVSALIPTEGPFFGKYYEFFNQLMNQLTLDPVVMIIMAVIMAPIFEEIIFRGIIQKGLINKGVNRWSAIVLSAILFGIVHANPWQFVGALLLGCVLGVVYERTKSLLLPILLHAFNNLCSSIFVTFVPEETFAEFFKVPKEVILGTGLLLFCVFYYLFTRKYKVHYSE